MMSNFKFFNIQLNIKYIKNLNSYITLILQFNRIQRNELIEKIYFSILLLVKYNSRLGLDLSHMYIYKCFTYSDFYTKFSKKT